MAARFFSTFLILSATFSLLTHSLPSNLLFPREFIYGDQKMTYGSCVLAMQTDCNLVLYDNGEPIWASGTYGAGQNCFLAMRYNGNLVIYSGKKALWSSNIEQTNEDNNVLVMQRDWKCNVVLYGRALWSTGNGHAHWSTGTNRVDTANAPSSLLTHSLGSNILRPGDLLYGDQEINEGSCRLAMQKDCNLVLYDSGMPIWASGTYGAGENCYLSMQYNGNLVLYSRKKAALWSSNTRQPDEGNYSLVLQRDWDCNVVLYGRALWSTQKNPVGTANVTISSDSTEPVVIAGDNISMVTDTEK